MTLQPVESAGRQGALGQGRGDLFAGVRAAATCLLVLVLLASPSAIAYRATSSPAPDTALRLAIAEGDLPGMARAVQAGARVNARYESGTSPLSEAVGLGRPEPVRWLVEHGADVNGTISTGVPPLFFALNGRSPAVLRVLLDGGADVGACLPGGRTPVHAACWHADESRVLAVVDALLAAGADADARDARGAGPLAYATEAGHARVAQRLVAAGAAGPTACAVRAGE